MIAIGFDTSNYTTSCAAYDGEAGENQSKLLDVKPGELGLRQSDALFSHIKRLPELSDRLFAHIDPAQIRAVGVSTRPRAVEGSYMPCFMAGWSQASVLAAALHVPLREFSHQQGHIAAVLHSAGREDLYERPFLAWHLSGGTTDISAGQLIDRTGQLLSMPFPAGKALDAASEQTQTRDLFRVKVTDFSFSFSGVQNKVQDYYRKTEDANAAAYYALASVVEAVRTATKNARKRYPGYPVLFSGGVASNSMLRRRLADLDAVFGEPR